MKTDTHGPLKDIRVLDASRVLAGPFCGQILGDIGADVIKLERPGAGDETRGWGPPFAGALSAYYLSCNRNKRAITLDISQPEGQTILHQLLDRCDVLLENFRSDSAVKLGLTPEQLLAKHPKLIVCSISGYGRTGPMKDVPGYDFAIQALSGMMAITGPVEGPPSKVGVAVSDVFTGLYAMATPSTWPCTIAPWRLRSTSPRLISPAAKFSRVRETPICKLCRTNYSRPPTAGSCWRSATTANGNISASRQARRNSPPMLGI
jgi:hypothetical protein